jgi:hypothetical protein
MRTSRTLSDASWNASTRRFRRSRPRVPGRGAVGGRAKTPRRRIVAIGGLVALTLGAAGVASALLGHGSSTELVYEAVATPQHPVTRASLDRTVDVMRERLRGSAPGATVRLAGRQISVDLPGVSPTAPIALEVGANAGVEVYDWEGSVIDAAGKIAGPDAPSDTGGTFAGSASGGVSLYQAPMRAVKRPPHRYPTSSTTDGTFYAVQAAHQRVIAGPALTRGQLALQLANAPAASRSSGTVRILHVPVGTTVVSGETLPLEDGLPDRSTTGYTSSTTTPRSPESRSQTRSSTQSIRARTRASRSTSPPRAKRPSHGSPSSSPSAALATPPPVVSQISSTW